MGESDEAQVPYTHANTGRLSFLTLRHAVCEYIRHYNTERNHLGLCNELIKLPEEIQNSTGEIICKERLGEMLRYYYRKAA